MSETSFSLSPLVAVDRAIGDFRRGIPVLIDDGAPGAASAVLAAAAELLRGETLAALAGWGAAASNCSPFLALTHHRAETLKIRRYTPEIVLLPQSDWHDAKAARGLADPSLDLDLPLRGPFHAQRQAVA